MACSTPGFPVLHCLLTFTQTHVHWVSDAIQPSHALLPPSPPVLNLSQHQGLFQVSYLHLFFFFSVLLMVHWNSIASSNLSIGASASASVLPNIQGWFPLGLTGLIFLQFKGLSRVFSSTMTSMLCNNCLFFSRTLAPGALLWLSHQVVYDSLAIWESPGKNTEVGCHFLFQGSSLSVIEPTDPAVSPAEFPALQAGSLLLSHLGSPKGDYFR